MDTTSELDLLIVAAHAVELTGFSAALGGELCAELYGRRVRAQSIGVGMTIAGAGTAHALAEQKPKAVILVGSFGRYPSVAPFRPGELLVPARIVAIDASELSSRAAFPAPMPRACEPDRELSRGLCEAGDLVANGTLATTLAITTDDELAAAIAARAGCVGENLEALAVTLACELSSARFASVLGCTNLVGSHGRSQWLEHHPLVARTTSQLLLRWLAEGATGL